MQRNSRKRSNDKTSPQVFYDCLTRQCKTLCCSKELTAVLVINTLVFSTTFCKTSCTSNTGSTSSASSSNGAEKGFYFNRKIYWKQRSKVKSEGQEGFIDFLSPTDTALKWCHKLSTSLVISFTIFHQQKWEWNGMEWLEGENNVTKTETNILTLIISWSRHVSGILIDSCIHVNALHLHKRSFNFR